MVKLVLNDVLKIKEIFQPLKNKIDNIEYLKLINDIETALILMDYETGAPNHRVDVSGYDTHGSSKAFGNSGFSGGCIKRVVPLKLTEGKKRRWKHQ